MSNNKNSNEKTIQNNLQKIKAKIHPLLMETTFRGTDRGLESLLHLKINKNTGEVLEVGRKIFTDLGENEMDLFITVISKISLNEKEESSTTITFYNDADKEQLPPTALYNLEETFKSTF